MRRSAGAVCDQLESRLFLHVDAGHSEQDHTHPLTVCDYPLPTSKVVKSRASMLTPHKGPFKSATIAASIPALNSYEQAEADIFLDFNGAPALTWGSFTSAVTPAYDTDGDASTFTAGELTNIQTIWSRVAEMFSPFNINVTTVDPGNLNDQETVRVIIGGTGSWYGSAGGVAYIGGFYNTASNIAWVFPKMLANGHVKYTADAIAHEAGHTFGLRHQSSYSGSTKTQEYNPGSAAKAPIMGNSYSATRSLWWNGPTTTASTIQNDVTVLSNSSNAFGYRADDHGGTTGTATAVDVEDNDATGAGVIELITDKDYFSFSTLTGTVSFTVAPATIGGMLDATLSLVTSAGTVITSANTTSMGETISASVAAGQYFLIVGSKGLAGDLGQYTLTGSIITSPNFVAAPAGVTATATNGEVVVRWTDMSWNETGFLIERSDDGGSNWDTVTTASAGATQYTDSSAVVGTTYQYRVRANGEVEDSDYSGTATVSVLPAAPSGLTAESVSATRIDIGWDDVAGETGYRVDRSTNNSTWTTIATLDADETDYSSTGLASGTRFYFRVVALSGVGNSTPSAAANTYTLPATPGTVTGSPTANAITVTWTNVSGETGYKVERSLDGETWAQIATTAVNVVSYANTLLTPNTTYYYRVKAFNPGGDAPVSSTLTKKTLLAPPAGLAASVEGMTAIDLNWTDSSGETNYRVEQLSGTTWVQVGNLLDPNETSLSLTGLVAGTAYSFRIRAYNESGASSPGTTVSATTIPAAPTTITAAALSTSQIRINWSNVNGEAGYKVERSPDGSDWTQIATTVANAVTFTDTLLSTDTLYYYRVKAYNAAGTGTGTSAASTRTLLAAPTGLVAEVVSTTQVDLSWTDSDGETNYRVERLSGTTWVPQGALLDPDTESLSVTGLVAGTAYSFRIRAYNAGGASLPSTAAAATTIPAAPATLTAGALSTSQISLSWSNIAGETGYKIERSPDGSDWTQIATTAANAVTYADTLLSTDTAYFYRVKPYNAAGTGAATSTATTRTLLAAPAGMAAEVVSTSRIDLSWTDSDTETGYRLERLSGTTWVQSGANLAADTTEVIVIGLTAGTAYSYRVRAINAGGLSLPSTAVTETTIPAAPTLTATALSDTQIRLNWTNVAGESGYKIERSPDDADWTQIATTTANTITVTDSSLSSDTTYYYRVRAWNAAADGAYSTSVSRRTLLPAPTGLTASAVGSTSIDLVWDDSTGETGYRVERLSGTTWVQVGSLLAANQASLTVTGLAGGTAYTFAVRAISSGGVSLQSTTSTATTRPAAPATLTTTNPAMGQIKLTWANVTGETGYRIERSPDGSDWTQIATVGVNIITYTNTGLSAGTYYYRVKAYNASGDSAAGPTATRTIS